MRARAIDTIDTTRDEALQSAVERCREALADYRAGLLDEAELHQLLLDAGVVRRPGEVWLLDLGANKWWRYDGMVVDALAAPATNGAIARLRDVIDELARDPQVATERGNR